MFTFPSPEQILGLYTHRESCISFNIMILNVIYDSLDFKSWMILIFVLLILYDVFKNKNPSNFPPGPLSLPFLGTIFTEMDFKTMDKLTEVYGNVFSLRVGSQKLVVISGYKLVKEALIEHDGFVDRPAVPIFHKTFKGLAPFNPQVILNSAISNIIACLVFGQRFDYHDENYQTFLRLDTECVQLVGLTRTQLYNVCPWLFEYIPGPHQKMFANYKKITDFLRGEIKKHKEDWDPLNPRDFIDSYLAEMEKKKSDPEAGFNMESLVVSCLDLVEAGTETATTTLRWGLLFMIKFPEIQVKVQEEIDRVIGQIRQPSLADKVNMPYTEAVINEIQRFGNAVPLGFPKLAAKDTMIGKYFIPKGTDITTNLSSVLNDPDEWETPQTFNPQHFLDDKGKLRKKDAFIPFSAGKRSCVGELLARMELFLFFTSILQRFTVSKCPGEEPTLEGEIWFTYAPSPFRICVTSR
ncbi:cytochrome P450 2J2-like isoform X2 [Paramisgurnus dabryanus]|uniref:cytochrome P450 2J2-like isoform X2 n=1 Tax=Paramisgurnus dabryanus TaxID=90735 RepID=UPI003CCFDC6A